LRTNGPSLSQLHETSCDGTLPAPFSAPRAHAAAAEIPLVRGAMSKQLHILRYPPMFVMHLSRTDVDGSKLHQNILVPLEWSVPPLLPKTVAMTATIQRPAPAALNFESVSVARPVSSPHRLEQAASLSRLGDEASLAPPALDSSSSWRVHPRDPFQASTLAENALPARVRYSLRAVVEHIGGSSGGHYVCFRQFDSRWYRMDDGRVSEVDSARVLGAEAYMLCYERC
jgi:ubiquitin C-terminal hydrolase